MVSKSCLALREDMVLQRMCDIRKAIQEYIAIELDIPQEWVTEYFELDEWYRNCEKNRKEK